MGRRTKPLIMKRHGGLTSLILLLSSHRTPSNSKKDKRERYKHQLLGATIIISHSQEHAKRREEKRRKPRRKERSPLRSFRLLILLKKKHPDKTLYPTRCIVVLRLSFSRMESSPVNPHEGISFLFTHIS